MQNFHAWTVDHPVQTLFITLILFACAVAGIGGISSTSDYRAYFGPDNPELNALEEFEHQFEQKETLILAMECRDGDLFSPQRLQALRELTEAGWTLPFAMRSQSMANHQHSYAEDDDIIVSPLIPDGPISEAQAQRVREIALNSDELVERFISPDGQVAALVVNTPLPHEDLNSEVPLVADAVRALFDEFKQRYPDLHFRASGVVMLNDAMTQTTRYDMSYLFPSAFLLIFLGLALYFRRLGPAILTQIIITLSVFTAYGMAGWMGFVLTAASLASGLIIMTLAVADCVHILVSWRQQMQLGQNNRNAMLESLRINTQPVFLTSLTTAIGFLSLNFADSPPFSDLGNMVAIGVAAALLTSLCTLPAITMLWPVSVPKAIPALAWEDRLADFTVRYQKRLLIFGLPIMLLLSAGVVHNRFGDNYAEYFADHLSFRQDTDFINERLTGMQMLQFVLHAEEAGGINDPAFLQRITEFQKWFEAQPETRKIISIVDLHKRLNKTMHGDDPDWHRLPENQELAAQYLFFYELSLPQGLSLNTLFDPDKQQTRFIALLDTIDAGQLAELNERARDWLHDTQPAWFYAPEGGVGIGLMFANISERNFRSMLGGMAVALILICALMIVIMRSWRVGLISIMPNLAPALMGFGVWGYSVGKIGISLAVVGSMTLGIVVDDTVHFLSKYLRARREEGLDPANAVRHAFRTVGSALLLTTFILTAGFLIISQSAYQLTAYMGLLTAITIALALLADFFILPALLMWLDRKQDQTAQDAP